MVDQSAWSVRNKQNEFFAKANHVRLAKNQISKRLVDAVSFVVSSLFANGEQGVWYAPDPDTCFTDTTGTTPAGAGDAVALMLDRSQGAGYSGGSFTGLGNELLAPIDFIDGNPQGTVNVPSANSFEAVGGAAGVIFEFPGVKGFVKVSGGFTKSDATTVFAVRAPTGSSNDDRFISTDDAGSFDFLVDFTDSQAVYFRLSEEATVTIDNISVRELPGNHATQGTAAARPILARVPEGGRRNLLTRTEEFDDAVWSEGSRASLTSGFVGSDGNASAAKVSDNNSNEAAGEVALFQDVAILPDTNYTFSIFLKKDQLTWAGVGFILFDENVRASFDLENGIVGTKDSEAVSSDIEDYGDGWYRCSISYNTTTTLNGRLIVNVQDGDHDTTIDLDGTSSILVYGAQLEEGSTATPYQRVGSTYDVTEAGKADKWHLVFDGVDDIMTASTPAITFQDVYAAMAGSHPDKGETAILFGAQDGAGDRHTFQKDTNDVAKAVNAAGSFKDVTGDSISSVSVLSNSRIGSTVELRQDGVSKGTTSQSGDTIFTASGSFFVGRNPTFSSVFAALDFYGGIWVQKTITETEVENTESYLAGKSGVTL